MNINEILSIKLTPEQLKECKEAFDMFDTDKDEIITTAQLVSALRALGYNINEIIIEKIKEVDVESQGTGKLKFEDFLDYVLMCIRYSFTKQDMIEDLRLIDVNYNGRVTKLELQNYLKKLNVLLCDEEIEEVLDAADLNKDGLIDYNKVASIMCFFDRENSNP